MKTRLLLFLLLLLSVALPAAAEAPIVVRIDSADASAYPQAVIEATVRNEYGGPITGLAAANFDVSEDRTLKSRPIVAVEPFVNPDVQLSVVLAEAVEPSPTLTSAPAAQPSLTPTPPPPPAPTTPPVPTPSAEPREAGFLGLGWLAWGGIGGAIFLLAGLATAVSRRASRPARSEYRCLRCGHALAAKDAPCPSCGFKGSYR